MTYIKKSCLFCEDDTTSSSDKDHVLLYPQTFKEDDLNEDVFSARRTTEHFHYRMLRCKKTGLVFSAEILPEDVLLTLYSGSKVTFNEFTDLIRKDYWQPLLPFAHLLTKDSAMEIGCSNGFFLEELLEAGFKKVYGCEPSVEAKNMARPDLFSSIHLGFFKAGLYPGNFFDFICSFQTLDHLSHPLEMLKVCYDTLKPKGFAYFITHNVDSLQAKLFGEKSPVIDVEHIYLFNKKTLQMLGEKAGFKTINVFDIHNSYPLRYWLRMAPLPFKSFFIKSAEFLNLSNLNIRIKPGNIGILLQKI